MKFSPLPANNEPGDSPAYRATNLKKRVKSIEDFEDVEMPNRINSELGKGSFGLVKLVKEKGDLSSKLYAMKVVCYKL